MITEKQSNMIVVGIGVGIALIFLTLVYMDSGTLEKLEEQHARLQQEIRKAQQKKNELKILKQRLYKLKIIYENFKKVLPTKKDYIKFYETLERFRMEENIQPWSYFKVKGKETETKEGISKKTNKRRRGRRKKKENFKETIYVAQVELTFNQLGKLLNLIENHKRFYGVIGVNIPSMKLSKEGEKKYKSSIKLELVSFSYVGETKIEKEVDKILRNYVPSEKLKKQIEEELEKDRQQAKKFIWRDPKRNPFNRDEVLIKTETSVPVISQEENILNELKPPLPEEELEKEFKKLNEIKRYLDSLAISESWAELQNALKEKDYERKLRSIKITHENDPKGIYRKKIEEMLKELKEWKIKIREADRKEKAQQLIIIARKKIEEMKKLYKEGKKKGSINLFTKVQDIHNEIMPQFKEYSDLEEKLPELKKLRLATQELYSKAETQIKIIKLASKIKLEGIIYIKDKPFLSVAFVNKKVVHKNDILMMGFILERIEEDGIILRYKDELVPIKLKRVSKKLSEEEL